MEQANGCPSCWVGCLGGRGRVSTETCYAQHNGQLWACSITLTSAVNNYDMQSKEYGNGNLLGNKGRRGDNMETCEHSGNIMGGITRNLTYCLVCLSIMQQMLPLLLITPLEQCHWVEPGPYVQIRQKFHSVLGDSFIKHIIFHLGEGWKMTLSSSRGVYNFHKAPSYFASFSPLKF